MNNIPLILIPGLLCDKTVWEHQINHLANIQCLVPDLSHIQTIDEMCAKILALTPHSFHLAGHSMGGWLALAIAIKYPERVRNLLILDTSAANDSEEKIKLRMEMISAYEHGERETIAKFFTDLFVYNKAIYAKVYEMFLRNIHSFVSQQKAMLARTNLLPFLSSIKSNTFVIHGQFDKAFYLSHSEEIANHIPHSRLIVIENAGHMVTMEAAKEVTSFMQDWIKL